VPHTPACRTAIRTSPGPGVGSGNGIDIPLDLPLNVCGNTVDPVALLNAVMGNSCASEESGAHAGPVAHSTHIGPPTDVRNLPPVALAATFDTALARRYEPAGVRFLGVDISSSGKLKVANAFDFFTDPVLPPPEPEKPERSQTSSKELPPTDTPSSVAKFTTVSGIAAPLHIENVDTDMIIPKQFLKTLKRSGLANALFFTLRKDPHTGNDTDFVLNRAPYNQAKILVCTGQNFGCGSSREHAPWSL